MNINDSHVTSSKIDRKSMERLSRVGTTVRPKRARKLSIEIIIGASLTLITFTFQLIALVTSHWKEISPIVTSLYVDRVDALIRTEVLHYFNAIHRETHLSYGLFTRCEYAQRNRSGSTFFRNDVFSFGSISDQSKRCTKNLLPFYDDTKFDECHSLQYYRFCTKAQNKVHTMHQDYLHQHSDSSASLQNDSPSSSCDCRAPTYIVAARSTAILAFISLLIVFILYILFFFVTNEHHRVQLKCLGILFGILGSLLIFSNLLIVSQHFQYEPIEYLVAIERHYKLNQIYKLSKDAKLATERFLSSIRIEIGYSAIFAWIALALAIVNDIVFLSICKIKHDEDEVKENSSRLNPANNSRHNEHQILTDEPVFEPVPADESHPFTPPPIPDRTPLLEKNVASPPKNMDQTRQPTLQLADDEV